MQSLRKLAIVVGHTPPTGGAKRASDGLSEFEIMSAFADLLQATMAGSPIEVEVFRHVRDGSYWRTVAPTIKAVNDWQADLMIELHFNSVPEGFSAWGRGGFLHWGDTYSFESKAGRAWGERLAPAIESGLGIATWGSRAQDRSWNAPEGAEERVSPRGHILPNGPILHMLHRTRMPALLLEAFNGANEAMCDLWDERRQAFAEDLALLLEDECPTTP